jgi:hypothetical protein
MKILCTYAVCSGKRSKALTLIKAYYSLKFFLLFDLKKQIILCLENMDYSFPQFYWQCCW